MSELPPDEPNIAPAGANPDRPKAAAHEAQGAHTFAATSALAVTPIPDIIAAFPPPLIPSDVDLRDFRFMPLDVVQLQNSETWAMADGWASKALVNLWTKAWHQVPAGSLPDNDDLHRTWANVPNWESVRDVALRGFIKCSDGQLYHRVHLSEGF